MLPIVRKRVYSPSYLNDFLGKDFLTSIFSDGADYTVPAVNIRESEKKFEIEVAAPGLNKEDFTIKIENDLLTISSEKESSEEQKEEGHFMRREFGFRSFSRSFSIPEFVDQDKIKASHKNGVLMIELPKMEESKMKNSKMIKIS
ncbi:MAG: Hsp20/alpha crystallin family protein [Bacteroidetes bacterium]|nr:Hsp20/alpha crystallin family protein [Bacteroidota bacterium]